MRLPPNVNSCPVPGEYIALGLCRVWQQKPWWPKHSRASPNSDTSSPGVGPYLRTFHGSSLPSAAEFNPGHETLRHPELLFRPRKLKEHVRLCTSRELLAPTALPGLTQWELTFKASRFKPRWLQITMPLHTGQEKREQNRGKTQMNNKMSTEEERGKKISSEQIWKTGQSEKQIQKNLKNGAEREFP